jgi:hypothetical protein
LADGRRVTNGELATVKSVRADGAIELADGRVLDKGFLEFLPGYAVTSYGSQGKTVDYVLFSDSTVKAATNAQQTQIAQHVVERPVLHHDHHDRFNWVQFGHKISTVPFRRVLSFQSAGASHGGIYVVEKVRWPF